MLATYASIVSFISEGAMIYSIAFLTLMPDYICNDGTSDFHCSR